VGPVGSRPSRPCGQWQSWLASTLKPHPCANLLHVVGHALGAGQALQHDQPFPAAGCVAPVTPLDEKGAVMPCHCLAHTCSRARGPSFPAAAHCTSHVSGHLHPRLNAANLLDDCTTACGGSVIHLWVSTRSISGGSCSKAAASMSAATGSACRPLGPAGHHTRQSGKVLHASPSKHVRGAPCMLSSRVAARLEGLATHACARAQQQPPPRRLRRRQRRLAGTCALIGL